MWDGGGGGGEVDLQHRHSFCHALEERGVGCLSWVGNREFLRPLLQYRREQGRQRFNNIEMTLESMVRDGKDIGV